jgi:hypothetical protein
LAFFINFLICSSVHVIASLGCLPTDARLYVQLKTDKSMRRTKRGALCLLLDITHSSAKRQSGDILCLILDDLLASYPTDAFGGLTQTVAKR